MKFTTISLIGALATFAAAAPTNNAPAVEVRGDATTAKSGTGGEDFSGTIGDTFDGAFGIAGEWVELVANLITGGHGKPPGYGGGNPPGYGGGNPPGYGGGNPPGYGGGNPPEYGGYN